MKWLSIFSGVFFSNYFLGILAVTLSIETSFQLHLPLNSPAWYLILFSSVILYYTRAVIIPVSSAEMHHPRSRWIQKNRLWVNNSQLILTGIFCFHILWYLIKYSRQIQHLSWPGWLLPTLIVLAAAGYVGKLPGINLRAKPWSKPLTIGLCWASVCTLLPLVLLRIESGGHQIPILFAGWLFAKNWLFCSVNAVLFDIKDLTDDSRSRLKTIVVCLGTKRTMYFVLLPVILISFAVFLLVTRYRGLDNAALYLNLIPFILLGIAVLVTQKSRSVLFYLVFIDGLLLLKALCGISASCWS